MSDPVRLSLAAVHALALQVLRTQGVSEAHALAIADTITAAERDDCKAHGLFRLPGYVRSVRSGKVTPDSVPEVHELAPAIVTSMGRTVSRRWPCRSGVPHSLRRHASTALRRWR
jgi:delta1-piperideine-2-carboxylate reductase